jgi:hypothetical protein
MEVLRGAVQAYREHGDRAQLDLLRQHGERAVAHALTMERVLPAGERDRFTAEVEAWLAGLPT